jgi:hypothetical protein
VDRIAKTFELMGRHEDYFYALLDGAGRCAFCHKPLKDEVSKLTSVGPDCAKQFGVPHTLAAATKRLELREKLLAMNLQ